MAVSKRIAKLLAKDPRFRRKFGAKVPTTASIKKQLGGTRIPTYAKNGGYIAKKKKKRKK